MILIALLAFAILLVILAGLVAATAFNMRCQQLGWDEALLSSEGVLCHDIGGVYVPLQKLEAECRERVDIWQQDPCPGWGIIPAPSPTATPPPAPSLEAIRG